jgi:ser/thr/tyr protein kinase RAD53
MANMFPPGLYIDNDGIAMDNFSATQSTQQTDQPTQLVSQEQQQTAMDAHLWGFLIPCSPELMRVDFMRIKQTYRVGRNAGEGFGNDIIFPGMKISACLIPFAQCGAATWLTLCQ